METENNLSKHSRGHICEIRMKLPSLNDYINLCRANRYQSADFKRQIEKDIGYYLKPLKHFKKPVIIHFVWIEKDMRRDADNIAFAKKFILDAMVKSRKIQDDSRRYVTGFTDTFKQGKETKVQIIVTEEE